MTADDTGTGGRDDPARTFTNRIAVIKVEISANFNGPLDRDPAGTPEYDHLRFPGSAGAPNDQAGFATPATGAAGFYQKVELIGTIYPLGAANGVNGFSWHQQVEEISCYHDATLGDWWRHPEQEVGWHDDDPEPEFQQVVPNQINFYPVATDSRIYMLDAPGPDSPNAPGQDRLFSYKNFTTMVRFNGNRASDNFDWHVVIKLENNGGGWTVQGAPNVGNGHTTMPPEDCSAQP
jgi:hypothetical protein